MKQVFQTALKRAHGSFLIVHEHEWAALDGLPAWACRLFMLLVRCTDFKTGHGDTSYSYLAERLEPVQPDRGPKHFAPTPQAVKRMVLQLEQRRILARDTRQSDGTRTLFFSLAPRFEAKAEKARPQKNSTPMAEPHAPAKNARQTGEIQQQAPELDPQSRPPLTALNLLSFPQPVDNSEGIDTRALAEKWKAKAKAAARGGDQQAPQGGQSIAAQAPHAPPGPSRLGAIRPQPHHQTDEGPAALSGLHGGALHGLDTPQHASAGIPLTSEGGRSRPS